MWHIEKQHCRLYSHTWQDCVVTGTFKLFRSRMLLGFPGSRLLHRTRKSVRRQMSRLPWPETFIHTWVHRRDNKGKVEKMTIWLTLAADNHLTHVIRYLHGMYGVELLSYPDHLGNMKEYGEKSRSCHWNIQTLWQPIPGVTFHVSLSVFLLHWSYLKEPILASKTGRFSKSCRKIIGKMAPITDINTLYLL